MKRNCFSSSEGSNSEADSPLTEKRVKPHLKQPRLLSGITNMAEADTDDMHNGKIIERLLKILGLLKLPLYQRHLTLSGPGGIRPPKVFPP